MRQLVPRKMVFTLEAFQAVFAASKSTEKVTFFGMRGLDMSCQVLPCDKSGVANAAHTFAWAMPALMMAATLLAGWSEDIDWT